MQSLTTVHQELKITPLSCQCDFDKVSSYAAEISSKRRSTQLSPSRLIEIIHASQKTSFVRQHARCSVITSRRMLGAAGTARSGAGTCVAANGRRRLVDRLRGCAAATIQKRANGLDNLSR